MYIREFINRTDIAPDPIRFYENLILWQRNRQDWQDGCLMAKSGLFWNDLKMDKAENRAVQNVSVEKK